MKKTVIPTRGEVIEKPYKDRNYLDRFILAYQPVEYTERFFTALSKAIEFAKRESIKQ